MSWLFSRALVEAYSEATCSGGGPFAPSSSTPTPLAYCAPDKMKALSRLSRFGTTFAPLTDDHGNRLLTWYLVGSHVRTLAQRERARELAAPVRDCGMRWPESFVRFDPASFSWKTPPSLLTGDSIPFSGRWPRWGTMRNGACSERQTSGPRTNGIEYGLWLSTPTASASVRSKKFLEGSVRMPTPAEFVKMWPTPRTTGLDGGSNSRKAAKARGMWPTPNARDWKDSPDMALQGVNPDGTQRSRSDQLARAVYATPTVSDATGGPGSSPARTGGDNLRTQIGGQLNPTWVEWLMGWPLGWTALNVSETDKSPPWRHWRFVFCMPACSGMNTTEAIK